MAINFPSSPANNDIHTDPSTGNQYIWSNVYSYWAVYESANTGGGVGSSTNTQVLFNDSGNANGNIGFIFNKTTNTVTVNTISVTAGLLANGSYGSANQILTTNGSVVYWANNVGSSSANLVFDYGLVTESFSPAAAQDHGALI